MFAFAVFDLLHPAKGIQPSPVWPWMIGTVVANLLAIGFLAHLWRRPTGWRKLDLSRAAWLILCGTLYLGGIACGVFIELTS
jgi:hypothetical protein